MREIVGSGWHSVDEHDDGSLSLIVDLAFGFPNIPDQDPNLSVKEQKKAARRKFPFGRPGLFISIIDPKADEEEWEGGVLKVKGKNHPIATIRRSDRLEDVAFDFQTGVHRTDIGLTEQVSCGLEIHYDGDDEPAGVVVENAIDLECEVGILGIQLVERRFRKQVMQEEAVALGKYGGYHDQEEQSSVHKMKVHVTTEKEDTSNDTN